MKKQIAVVALISALFSGAQSQTFPSRPITLVVNSEVGGPVDVNARLMRDELQAALGQPIIVENRLGGGGQVGAAMVARAAPDGYTLLLCSPGAVVIAPHLYNLPYDPLKDFEPVNLITEVPVLFAISINSPAKTLGEFVALAKANPGKFNYSSSGNSTPAHLGSELLKSLAGIDITHVPYRGTPQALQALMTDDVALFLSGPAAVLPQDAAGKIRLVAVTTKNRIRAAPHVPTTAEAGLPELTVPAWYGIFAPKGTPRQVVATLNAAIKKTLENKTVRERFEAASYLVIGDGPDLFTPFMKKETDRWGEVIKKAGIKG